MIFVFVLGYARLIWLDTTTARVPEEVVRPIRPRTLIALQNSSANIKKQTTLSSFSLPFLSFRLVSSFLFSTRTRPRRPVFKLVKKELETFGTHLPVLRSCMVLAVAWLARVRGFGVGDRLLTCGRGPGVRGGGQGTGNRSGETRLQEEDQARTTVVTFVLSLFFFPPKIGVFLII